MGEFDSLQLLPIWCILTPKGLPREQNSTNLLPQESGHRVGKKPSAEA